MSSVHWPRPICYAAPEHWSLIPYEFILQSSRSGVADWVMSLPIGRGSQRPMPRDKDSIQLEALSQARGRRLQDGVIGATRIDQSLGIEVGQALIYRLDKAPRLYPPDDTYIERMSIHTDNKSPARALHGSHIVDTEAVSILHRNACPTSIPTSQSILVVPMKPSCKLCPLPG